MNGEGDPKEDLLVEVFKNGAGTQHLSSFRGESSLPEVLLPRPGLSEMCVRSQRPPEIYMVM